MTLLSSLWMSRPQLARVAPALVLGQRRLKELFRRRRRSSCGPNDAGRNAATPPQRRPPKWVSEKTQSQEELSDLPIGFSVARLRARIADPGIPSEPLVFVRRRGD